MTRPELEAIKSKPHGPDVDRLIQEIEDCWEKIADLDMSDADWLDYEDCKEL